MQRLADENRRAGDRYGELSNANHNINNRILTLLTERWESEETTLEDKNNEYKCKGRRQDSHYPSSR